VFTGIVTDIGLVTAREERGDTRFVIASDYPAHSIALGASIACSGCCLTVTDRGIDGDRSWFTVDASAETLSLTTAQYWQDHVDGLAHVLSVAADGDSHRVEFEAPAQLAKFIAAKGSVTLDGVSLTVNSVEGSRFGVNVIPHTWNVTTLGALETGARINLEIDILARYVSRLDEAQRQERAHG